MINLSLVNFIKMLDNEKQVNANCSLIELMEALSDLTAEKPKVFANHFKAFEEIINFHSQEITLLQKAQLIQRAMEAFQLHPTILKKNPLRIQQLFQLTFQTMVSIPFEVPPQWFTPEQGFDSDNNEHIKKIDPSSVLFQNCMKILDRLACVIGYQKFLTKMKNTILNLYNTQDWRYKAAVLMCISQISENIQDMKKLLQFTKLIQMGAQNDHPKVRFAAAHALGQLADDLKPMFQQFYSDDLFPLILRGLNDPIERCSSHWFACITNFLEDFTDIERIVPELSNLVQIIGKKISTGNSLLKENSMATLASLGSIVGIFQKQIIKRPLQIIHMTFSTFDVKGPYHQLINQAIECLTIFLVTQPPILIQQYIPLCIETFINLGKQIDSDYLYSGWNRLCMMGVEFEGRKAVFNIILEKLFNDLEIQTPQNKTLGIEAVTQTVQLFQSDFQEFSKPCLEKFHESIENTYDDGLLKALIQSITTIICEGRGANPSTQGNQVAKNSINLFFTKSRAYFDSDQFQIVEKFFDNIQTIMKSFTGFIQDSEVTLYTTQYMNFNQFLADKKQDLQANQAQMLDMDDEDKMDEELIDNDYSNQIKQLEQIKLQIPDILKELLKKIKDPELFKNTIKQHIEHASSILENVEKLSIKQIQYGLYFLDNLVENYDYQILKEYWQLIHNFLQNLSTHHSSVVRNAAIWGYGQMIKHYPTNQTTMEMIKCWTALVEKCYRVEQGSDTVRQYKFAQDNSVSVLGKIIEIYSNKFNLQDLVKQWLNLLPLKDDKEQGINQIEILNYILKNQHENIAFSPEVLIEIFRVYGEFIKLTIKKMYKAQNKKVLGEVKGSILSIIKWDIFANHKMEIEAKLQKNILNFIQDLAFNGKYL